MTWDTGTYQSSWYAADKLRSEISRWLAQSLGLGAVWARKGAQDTSHAGVWGNPREYVFLIVPPAYVSQPECGHC